MTHERILILDGQTTQALACARSFGRAGFGVVAASTLRRPLAAWSRYCAESYRLPAESVAAMSALRSWAGARNVTAVLPLTERSHFLLNAEREQWHAAGIVVACAEHDVLEQAFDKALTLDLAARTGAAVPALRIPSSLDDCDEIAEALGFPCIVKTRFTAVWNGSRLERGAGTRYVQSLADLRDAVVLHRQAEYWPIVQRFVPGTGKGVFTVCERGRPLAWFAHRRLRDVRPTGSGSSLRSAAKVDPRLLEPAARLLAAMRWHGPAMVEFRDDGIGAPWLMEVNGRFWGSLQLAVSSGIDFPRMWMEVVRGASTTAPTHFREDVTLRWLWGDAKRLLNILAGPSPGFPGHFPTRWAGIREILGPQPVGTQSETWDPLDPWPAVGEWVQGIAGAFDRSQRSAVRAWLRNSSRTATRANADGALSRTVVSPPTRPQVSRV
jgi:predicted ATP-grasp superfamily ATP-dependent carboligase